VGITVGSREVPGEKACDKRQHNNDDDDDDDDDDKQIVHLVGCYKVMFINAWNE
jgi:hypothetical protein